MICSTTIRLSKFQSKENYQGQIGTIHNDKGSIQQKDNAIPKCVHTKQYSYKVCEAKTDRIVERQNRSFHKYNWNVQHPLSTTNKMRQKISKVIEELIITINQHYQNPGPHTC